MYAKSTRPSSKRAIRIFYYKFTSIFSNNYFSIHSNPLYIILNLFLYLFQYKSTSIFSNTYTFLSLTILHQSSLVSHNTRLFFTISPLISHSILHLSTSIFFYLLANLVDAYLLYSFSIKVIIFYGQ